MKQTETKRIEIFDHKERFVGYLENNVYYTVRKPQHFFIKYQGFGISESVLDNLNKKGCYHVCILYYNKDQQLNKLGCPLSYFLHSSKKHDDNGDVQRFVSKNEFNNGELNK